jgi:endonuclease/exonuclease/phosphatase family metal-dependent hydrolase
MRLRVLSYNIHKGFAARPGLFTLPKIREAIRSVNVDVVMLQEVVGKNSRLQKKHSEWPDQSQFEFLADSVWPHYAYGQNAIYDHGHHGNAILSQFPFESWTNTDISNYWLERRGILHGQIRLASTRIHFVCLHLDLTAWGRNRQMRVLKNFLSQGLPSNEPVIVAGDFNDWRGGIKGPSLGENIKEIFEDLQGQFARTFPAWYPRTPLDRIYFSNLIPISAECLSGAPWNQLSDHAALVGTFEIKV